MTRVHNHRVSLFSEARFYGRDMIGARPMAGFAGKARSGMVGIKAVAGSRSGVMAVEAATYFAVEKMPAHGLLERVRYGVRLVYCEVPGTVFRIICQGRHEDAAIPFE